MREIEAIYGIFTDQEKVLLLKRTPKRTFSPGKWDLMGGDIQEGETPLSTLQRDAAEKLHIQTLSVQQQGEVLVKEGTTEPIRRFYFVCNGDYSNLVVDPKKYDQYGWYNSKEVTNLELSPGVLTTLRTVGFLKTSNSILYDERTNPSTQ